MDEVQPQDVETNPQPVPSFGKLLVSSPIEPGDLPERNNSPFRETDL